MMNMGFFTIRNAAMVGVGTVLIPLAVFASPPISSIQSYINDAAGMFTLGEVQSLDKTLSRYEAATRNEIAVVTIPTLAGSPIEDYAEKLFAEWGIGKSEEDNGVLLLIARDDRAVRIEVGYGLEPVLTDLESKAIIESVIVPAFRDGRYGDGVLGAVDAMIEAIGGEYTPPSPDPFQNIDIDWFWLFFFVPLWLASILGRSKSWWAGGVIGGIAGVVLGFVFGFLWTGIAAVVLLTPLGLLFDFLVSRAYARGKTAGHFPWWIGGGGFHGGGHGGFGGGGFGGFGGGMSGGGGASGRW